MDITTQPPPRTSVLTSLESKDSAVCCNRDIPNGARLAMRPFYYIHPGGCPRAAALVFCFAGRNHPEHTLHAEGASTRRSVLCTRHYISSERDSCSYEIWIKIASYKYPGTATIAELLLLYSSINCTLNMPWP